MSRNILAIVGILFCSASAMGQEFVAPKIDPTIQPSSSGFQPPANTNFSPANSSPVIISPSNNLPANRPPAPIQEPQVEEKPVIIPTKSENKATIQPAPRINAAPVLQAKPVEATTQEQNDQFRPQPPIPEQNDFRPVQEEPLQAKPAKPMVAQPAPNQATIELPQPKPAIKTVELKEDNQIYRSSGYNQSGVSEYRLAVAREKARARRMRMEVKKWYGIDSARPTTLPRVDISVYSGYYNGVPSRYGYQYGNPYHNSASFYFHVPVNR